jgi:hypothetical protein
VYFIIFGLLLKYPSKLEKHSERTFSNQKIVGIGKRISKGKREKGKGHRVKGTMGRKGDGAKAYWRVER